MEEIVLKPKKENTLHRFYLKTLRFLLRRRGIALLLSGALLCVFAVPLLSAKVEVMPSMDRGEISIGIEMPLGSSLEQTAIMADEVVTVVLDAVEDADSCYYQVKGTSADVTLKLVDKGERNRGIEDISSALREDLNHFAGCEITVDSGGNMMGGEDFSVVISGDNYDVLTDLSGEFTTILSQLPDAVDIASSVEAAVPQVYVYANKDKASRYGVSTATIGAAVRSELTGIVSTQITIDGAEIDIIVKGDDMSSSSVEMLKSLPIPTATGTTIALEQLADIEIGLVPQSITRINQRPSVKISATSQSDDATTLTKDAMALLEDYPLPSGYVIEENGQSASMKESFGSLLVALTVAICLVYFILASQFNSYALPITIMLMLPLSVFAGLAALPLTGKSISTVSIMAVVMLVGTVVNPAIILVDYIHIRRNRGEDKNTAIINACPRRIRPILMTAFTTLLGLIPMMLNNGDGNEMMAPMAVVMIAGMAVSIVATLLFTPVYYSLIDSVINRCTIHEK